jgi:hypothetical protein
MKGVSIFGFVALTAACVASVSMAAGSPSDEAAPIFGVKIPPGYRDWRLISSLGGPNLSLPGTPLTFS